MKRISRTGRLGAIAVYQVAVLTIGAPLKVAAA
jgi:hypothetical protein